MDTLKKFRPLFAWNTFLIVFVMILGCGGYQELEETLSKQAKARRLKAMEAELRRKEAMVPLEAELKVYQDDMNVHEEKWQESVCSRHDRWDREPYIKALTKRWEESNQSSFPFVARELESVLAATYSDEDKANYNSFLSHRYAYKGWAYPNGRPDEIGKYPYEVFIYHDWFRSKLWNHWTVEETVANMSKLQDRQLRDNRGLIIPRKIIVFSQEDMLDIAREKRAVFTIYHAKTKHIIRKLNDVKYGYRY